MLKKIVLLTKRNSYIGREYASALQNKKIYFSVIQIGKEKFIDHIEDARCGGLWRPPILDYNKGCKIFNLPDFNLEEFRKIILEEEITLGIQADIGCILKPSSINLFRDGIINFHPGDLPNYRGCSAPEWQLFEGNEVICSCHYIDHGIDTGNIIGKKELCLNKNSYNQMRASVYPEISKYMVKVSAQYMNGDELKGYPQGAGKYRKYIGSEKIEYLAKKLFVK